MNNHNIAEVQPLAEAYLDVLMGIQGASTVDYSSLKPPLTCIELAQLAAHNTQAGLLAIVKGQLDSIHTLWVYWRATQRYHESSVPEPPDFAEARNCKLKAEDEAHKYIAIVTQLAYPNSERCEWCDDGIRTVVDAGLGGEPEQFQEQCTHCEATGKVHSGGHPCVEIEALREALK